MLKSFLSRAGCIAALASSSLVLSSASTAFAQSETDSIVANTFAQAVDYHYQSFIAWSPVPSYPWRGASHGSPYFLDVLGHTNDRYLRSTPTTNAHETAHGLHAQMRNAKSGSFGFFYNENGQGAYVENPRTPLSSVAAYVPQSFRSTAGMRYQTYVVDQAQSWSELLYLFDEWTAYTVNARVALEIYKAGQWSYGSTDEMDGAADLLCFAAASLAALEANEPEYLSSNAQFKATFAWLAERTMALENEGLALAPFQGFHARQLLDQLRTSPDAQHIRQALINYYGSAFTTRVFGF